jgi:predicted metal-dependent hydrolase
LKLKPSPRARVMRLKVDSRTGEVTLTYPRRIAQRKALAWAAEQRAWIEARLRELPDKMPIRPGSTLSVEGVPHRIDWQESRSRTVRVEQDRIVVGGPLETLEARLLRWLKAHALKVLERETLEYAGKAGVTVSKVGVGDPVSRWGAALPPGRSATAGA